MEREDVVATPEGGRVAVLVALAAGFSAGVSYVVMWLAAHTLSTSAATVFLTLLSVLFFSYGLLSGLAIEVTRSSAAAQRDGAATGPSLWRVGTVSSLICSAVLVLAVLGLHGRLLGPDAGLGEAVAVALLMGLGIAAYSFHSAAVGALTGRRQWSGSARVIGAEAALRLALTATMAAAGAGVLGMVAGSTLSALAVGAVLAVAPSIRGAMRSTTDRPGAELGRRIVQSMLAQASAAAIVVGFPMLLAATSSSSDYRHAAPLILAISLTRAPLLVPLNAVQGMTVSYLVHAGSRIGRALLIVVAGIAVVGGVGTFLAWVAGPWLMTTIFGSDYFVAGWTLGLLTASATLLALLTVTGATCQAAGRHAIFLAGWLVATVVTALLLTLPGSLEQRSVSALMVGPSVGLAVHVASILRDVNGGRRSGSRQSRVRA